VPARRLRNESLTEARIREHHGVRIIEADHHPAILDAVVKTMVKTMVKARINDEEPRIRPAKAITPVESVEMVVMPEPVVMMLETVMVMPESHMAAAVVKTSEVTAAASTGQHHAAVGVVAGPGCPGDCLATAKAGEEQDQEFEDAHGEPSRTNPPGIYPQYH
jgi:hypothetical protein